MINSEELLDTLENMYRDADMRYRKLRRNVMDLEDGDDLENYRDVIASEHKSLIMIRGEMKAIKDMARKYDGIKEFNKRISDIRL